MEVTLVKLATYELKGDKVTEMPFETFDNLCNLCKSANDGKAKAELPRAMLFKSIDEFLTLSESERSELDTNKKVSVLSNGQFIIFMKERTKNVAADTEENKGE